MRVIPQESEIGRLAGLRDCIAPSPYTVMQHLSNRDWRGAVEDS
jgi:hypothetical protein